MTHTFTRIASSTGVLVIVDNFRTARKICPLNIGERGSDAASLDGTFQTCNLMQSYSPPKQSALVFAIVTFSGNHLRTRAGCSLRYKENKFNGVAALECPLAADALSPTEQLPASDSLNTHVTNWPLPCERASFNPINGLLFAQQPLCCFEMLSHFLRRIRSFSPPRAFTWPPIAKPIGPFPYAKMASTFPDLPIFRAIANHDPRSTAIIHAKSHRSFTYGELLKDVEGAKINLYHQLKHALKDDEQVGGQRVAFMVENSYDYVGAKGAPPRYRSPKC